MAGLKVTRWTKNGKDRLYVTDEEGMKVGFFDLERGTSHLDRRDLMAAFEVAVSRFRQQLTAASDSSSPTNRARPPAQEPPVTAPSAGQGAAGAPRQGARKDRPNDSVRLAGLAAALAGNEVSTRAPVRPERASAPPHHTAPLAEPDAKSTLRSPVRALSLSASPSEDLAARQAGYAARAKAQEVLSQAPLRYRAARLLGRKTEERAWRIGADAEQATGRILDALGPNWHALHAVPVGVRGSDIDHVLIGPAGIYTINTKNHPGATILINGETVLVNNTRQPYVRNSRHEADRAQQLLERAAGKRLKVTGLIVMHGSATSSLTVRAQPHGNVQVVSADNLHGWLLSRRVTLEEGVISRLYGHARQRCTWQPKGPVA